MSFSDLPAEIWLKILALLDLRSKGRMACVCRSLHHIVSNFKDVLWSRVDLTNPTIDITIFKEGIRPTTSSSTWSFPSEDSDVLHIAQAYFGPRLQDLQLHIATTPVLQYLHDHCPGLESIRLEHGQMSLKNADLGLMPPNLKTLDLCLKGCFLDPRSRPRICSFGVPPLEKLEALTLRFTEFSPHLFHRVCQFHQLQELVLHQCSFLTLYGVNMIVDHIPELRLLWFRYCVIPVSGASEFETIIHECSTKLKHLKQFKIQSLRTKNNPPLELDIPSGMLPSLKDFHALWLDNINLLAPAAGLCNLKDLRELELVNCYSVDNQVVIEICQNLDHLKHLNLQGCRQLTDNCMSCMSYFRFLEYLNVHGCSISMRCICSTVDVMESLKIIHLTKNYSKDFGQQVIRIREKHPGLLIHERVH